MGISSESVRDFLEWGGRDIHSLLKLIALDGATNSAAWEADLVTRIIVEASDIITGADDYSLSQLIAADLRSALREIDRADTKFVKRLITSKTKSDD